MSDFTIEQLEALKAGTTEGPWEEEEYGIGPLYANIYDEIVSRNPADIALAAAAPALVDALIAEKQENQRIRTELEAENKAQAEQIERLQAAVSSLMEGYRDLDYTYWWEHHAPGIDTYTPVTIEDYGLIPGDMEATDE